MVVKQASLWPSGNDQVIKPPCVLENQRSVPIQLRKLFERTNDDIALAVPTESRPAHADTRPVPPVGVHDVVASLLDASPFGPVEDFCQGLGKDVIAVGDFV